MLSDFATCFCSWSTVIKAGPVLTFLSQSLIQLGSVSTNRTPTQSITLFNHHLKRSLKMFRLAAALLVLAVVAHGKNLRNSGMRYRDMVRHGLARNSRIVGGEDSAPGEINWQISFQSTSFGAFHFCGGSVYTNVSILSMIKNPIKTYSRLTFERFPGMDDHSCPLRRRWGLW